MAKIKSWHGEIVGDCAKGFHAVLAMKDIGNPWNAAKITYDRDSNREKSIH
jgi:hypothetical protein